jgi:hypothetical protein
MFFVLSNGGVVCLRCACLQQLQIGASRHGDYAIRLRGHAENILIKGRFFRVFEMAVHCPRLPKMFL